MENPRWFISRLILLCSGVALAASAALLLGMGGLAGVGWRLVNGLIHRKFPDVQSISTAELSACLSDPKRPGPLLLDVREPAEYGASHLPGARRFPPGGSGELLADWPKDAPVVTYCSVGYRSAALAQRLQAAGFTKVRNLQGSAFAWANEGRPLVDAGGQITSVVHPYDPTWGLLVKPEARWRGKPEAPSASP